MCHFVGVEMYLGTVVAALIRLGLPLAVVVVVGVGGNTSVARYGSRRGILIVVRTGLTIRSVWRAVVLFVLMVVISHRTGSK